MSVSLGLFGVDAAGVPNAFHGGMTSYIIYKAQQRVSAPNAYQWYTALLDVAVEHLGLQNTIWELPKSFPSGIREILVDACHDMLRSMDCNEICDLSDDELAGRIAHWQHMVKRGWSDHKSTLALGLEERADRDFRHAIATSLST